MPIVTKNLVSNYLSERERFLSLETNAERNNGAFDSRHQVEMRTRITMDHAIRVSEMEKTHCDYCNRMFDSRELVLHNEVTDTAIDIYCARRESIGHGGEWQYRCAKIRPQLHSGLAIQQSLKDIAVNLDCITGLFERVVLDDLEESIFTDEVLQVHALIQAIDHQTRETYWRLSDQLKRQQEGQVHE